MTDPLMHYRRTPRTSAGFIRTQATSGPVARKRPGIARRLLPWALALAGFLTLAAMSGRS